MRSSSRHSTEPIWHFANSHSFEFKFVQCRISAPMSRLPRQFALTSNRGSTTRPRHTAIFIAAQLGHVQCSEIAIGRDVAVTIESRSDPSSSRCQIRARALKPRGLMAGAKDVFSANEQPGWWSQTGSNRRPPACKAGALPTELWPLQVPETRSRQSGRPRRGVLMTDT